MTIKILDIIDHKYQYGTQRSLILDRMPAPLFERRGNLLIGHDSGFFRFYAYERPDGRWKAFGGSRFSIPLVDGTFEEAFGQWWDCFPADFRGLTYDHGIGTVGELADCHVFAGGFHVDCDLVDRWLKAHDPSNNYHKYDTRHADFGKHTIESKWR